MTEDLKLGWLSPEGEFIQCQHYDHTSVANDILNRLDNRTSYFQYHRPDDKLLELGWVHISIDILGKRELVIYWNKFLTEIQKEFLKPYFETTLIDVSFSCKAKWEKENEI